MGRSSYDLAVGEADGPPPGDGVPLVAAAVELERLAGAVGVVAVGLDDQAVLGPGEVDFVAFDEGVETWRWNPVVAADLQEQSLELVGSVTSAS